VLLGQEHLQKGRNNVTKEKIKILFTDLGGVLLTNGWDRSSREKAVAKFDLDSKEFESRHQLLFGDYEASNIDLKTYLEHAVFYQPRNFTYEQFTDFMYEQSQPFPEMIDYIKRLKQDHNLRLVAISNEGKDLTRHRIEKLKLNSFIDFFVVSCFVGTRKPDPRMWKLALDFVQIAPEHVLYLEDRKLFVEIASGLGIHAICHKDLETTSKAVSLLF
jgi:putative hydrolase of the HAD superfamily